MAQHRLPVPRNVLYHNTSREQSCSSSPSRVLRAAGVLSRAIVPACATRGGRLAQRANLHYSSIARYRARRRWWLVAQDYHTRSTVTPPEADSSVTKDREYLPFTPSGVWNLSGGDKPSPREERGVTIAIRLFCVASPSVNLYPRVAAGPFAATASAAGRECPCDFLSRGSVKASIIGPFQTSLSDAMRNSYLPPLRVYQRHQNFISRPPRYSTSLEVFGLASEERPGGKPSAALSLKLRLLSHPGGYQSCITLPGDGLISGTGLGTLAPDWSLAARCNVFVVRVSPLSGRWAVHSVVFWILALCGPFPRRCSILLAFAMPELEAPALSLQQCGLPSPKLMNDGTMSARKQAFARKYPQQRRPETSKAFSADGTDVSALLLVVVRGAQSVMTREANDRTKIQEHERGNHLHLPSLHVSGSRVNLSSSRKQMVKVDGTNYG
ncbi:hypothetical protein BKA93DRAFT_748447 [Sparassis latifolia]